MTGSTTGRRRQHAIMATDSEWARIRECAAAEGMDISRFVVHRATTADVVPTAVMRRALREILVAGQARTRAHGGARSGGAVGGDGGRGRRLDEPGGRPGAADGFRGVRALAGGVRERRSGRRSGSGLVSAP